jgi:hypothetical protein
MLLIIYRGHEKRACPFLGALLFSLRSFDARLYEALVQWIWLSQSHKA